MNVGYKKCDNIYSVPGILLVKLYYYRAHEMKTKPKIKRKKKYSRNVSAPLDARRLGLVLDAEMLRCTPRCVGLCTDDVPPPLLPVAVSFPAIFRSESEEPDREPSDSGCLYPN